MQKCGTVALVFILALGSSSCSSTPGASSGRANFASATSPAPTGATMTGFAFVDSSVTSQGARSKLPPGTKIYPSGSKVTGNEGCPTNRYRTDGNLVVVIDYDGRPTSASVAVTRHPASGGSFENAPYYLDLDPGRRIQTLGPIFDNGTYDLLMTYDYSLGPGKTTKASITLARTCPNV